MGANDRDAQEAQIEMRDNVSALPRNIFRTDACDRRRAQRRRDDRVLSEVPSC